MQKTVAIIGGGPASMLLAAHLNPQLFKVTVYEKNNAFGRKFLVAGKGGFNLSHSEELNQFISRYTPHFFLEEALKSFQNKQLANWLEYLDIPTFTGSSKRIYPKKGIKPIQVLNAILKELKQKNVELKTNCSWTGWNKKEELIFNSQLNIQSDITVFALGGATWGKTGSDGNWTQLFKDKGIETIDFEASNCRFYVDWAISFIEKSEGLPLKNITVSCDGKTQKGEVIITQNGIEGGAIYALSPQIRTLLNLKKEAIITIDLKPNLSREEIIEKIKGNQVTKQLSTKLKLEKIKVNLLKTHLNKEQFLDPSYLANRIKSFPLKITSLATVEEAISSVGGIDLKEIDAHFQLKKIPHHYTIGEMLDYDAPTGGYLLQSCFSMGVFLANHLNNNYGKKD